MTKENIERFANQKFEDFRAQAKDENLSQYEKIGFPDSYRLGKEEGIFRDIKFKLQNLGKNNQTILDIGPGCGSICPWQTAATIS